MIRLLCFSALALSHLAQTAEAKELFSVRAWHQIETVYVQIKAHPFNQELMRGTLSKERFKYYSQQDALYLPNYSRALAVLATRLENSEASATALQLAGEAAMEGSPPSGTMNPSTFNYINFLLAEAAFKTPEELAAALLPCFWIYLQLARDLKQETGEANPYYYWIKSYSSSKYETSVNKMRRLTDQLADGLSEKQVKKMLTSFEMASRLEWYFWEAAYSHLEWLPKSRN